MKAVKETLRTTVNEDAIDLLLLVIFLTIWSTWLWGPVLKRVDEPSDKTMITIICLSIVITIQICLIGGVAIAQVLPL